MYTYKSKTGVVNYKRFAINSFTGITLANQHPDLDKLVESGDLVLEAPTPQVVEVVPAAPTAPTAPVKNETPAKPTA
jgi:hypothetical protein